VERVVGDVLGRFGSLDILVNDAAYSSRARNHNLPSFTQLN
jgi:NAD(P)-dependent dehydrogenase (short-subunit alcohol dehydrogenase family)